MHFEVARCKKIAHIDWLQFIEGNTILIIQRTQENNRTIIKTKTGKINDSEFIIGGNFL